MKRYGKPLEFHLGCLLSAATFFLLCPASSYGAAGSELRRTYSATPFMSTAAEVDPLGTQDPFESLSEREKSRWAGSKEDVGVEAKLRKLKSLEVTVAVDVKLVGFDGDGHLSINIKQGQLAKYLEALKTDPHVHVIHGESHKMAFKNRIQFHASKTATRLTKDVSSAINKAIKDAAPLTGSASGAVTIPHEAIDSIIGADFGDASTFSLYILNPRVDGRGGAQNAPYSYTYGDAKGCSGTVFAGRSRYAWVDLTAGPVSYGALEHGEGLVANHTWVRASSYSRDQMEGPFLARLVSLASQSSRYLFSPALYHHPLPFAVHTEVRVVHLKGAVEDMPEEGLDAEAIEKELKSVVGGHSLLLPRQELSVKTSNLFLSHCAFCSAAYARSIRTYSPSLSGGALKHYLDSEEMHHLLAQFWPEIKTLAGVQEPAFLGPTHPSSGRLIPVFVLDLETHEGLLLDGTEQAVAYDDMVIAVRTKGEGSIAHQQCGGSPITLDPANVNRPVLAALLQTGWGVTPPTLSWSALHNRTEEDFRWGVGHTPFGPFSPSLSLSFADRGAAARNLLLSLLNDTVADAVHVLQAVRGYGGEEALLPNRLRASFGQRWALLDYKLRHACSLLSHHDGGHALYYLRAARHDVEAMLGIAKEAAGGMHTALRCFREPPTPWLWYGAMLLAGGGLGSIWVNRDALFKVKHKRF